jgi:hypothetical protein
MASMPTKSVKTSTLIAIFIRVSIFLQTLKLGDLYIRDLLNSLAVYDNSSNEYGYKNTFPKWQVYLSGFNFIEIAAFIIVFINAKKIGKWIGGQESDLIWDGSLELWIQVILQFIGIVMVVLGLSSTGSLVGNYLAANDIGSVYAFDPKIWAVALDAGVKFFAGIGLLVFPGKIAKGLGILRQTGW